MKIPLLKFIHGGLLTGMPSLIYNPFTKNSLNIPLTILPDSIYLNFKLTPDYSSYLERYIQKYSDNLSIVPVCLFTNEESSKAKYLSVNIYNCSSPVFLNGNKQTLRCELNTYIKDKTTGQYGTLILDYLSNDLSMDPINLFKLPPSPTDGAVIYNMYRNDPYHPEDQCQSYRQTKQIQVVCCSKKDRIKLNLNLSVDKTKEANVITSKELVKFSDYIYYKNGIYDKLYYDDTLVNAILKSPSSLNMEDDTNNNFFFTYKDLFFEKIDSIFYFENKINFVGSMWENVEE
tara:strand:- start:3435 stop:4301 length:867 start_codon:yes stop_codon:yes gene_type:complete